MVILLKWYRLLESWDVCDGHASKRGTRGWTRCRHAQHGDVGALLTFGRRANNRTTASRRWYSYSCFKFQRLDTKELLRIFAQHAGHYMNCIVPVYKDGRIGNRILSTSFIVLRRFPRRFLGILMWTDVDTLIGLGSHTYVNYSRPNTYYVNTLATLLSLLSSYLRELINFVWY